MWVMGGAAEAAARLAPRPPAWMWAPEGGGQTLRGGGVERPERELKYNLDAVRPAASERLVRIFNM